LQKLREDLQTLEIQHSQYSGGVSVEVLVVMKQWCIEHETNYDRKYIPYIKEYDSKSSSRDRVIVDHATNALLSQVDEFVKRWGLVFVLIGSTFHFPSPLFYLHV
jgi:hypothetical protein